MLHEPIFRIELGAALLGWIAGDIMVTDPAVAGWVQQNAAWLLTWHAAPIAGAVFVTVCGNLIHRLNVESRA